MRPALLTTILSLLLAAPASALTLDFGDATVFPLASWLGQGKITVNVGGVDVTVQAFSSDPTSTGQFLAIDTTFFSNPPRGVGVFTAPAGLDSDDSEISDDEVLTLTFSKLVTLESFTAAKMFLAGEVGDVVNEQGLYSINGGTGIGFMAYAPDTGMGQNDGFQLFDAAHGFGPVAGVSTIAFRPEDAFADMDFTIRSLVFSVPEPGVATLLLAGLVGLAARRRRA